MSHMQHAHTSVPFDQELFALGFDWEVNNTDFGGSDYDVTYCWYHTRHVMDFSRGMFYGLDYFVERDLVH